MLCATEIEVARQIEKESAVALFPNNHKFEEYTYKNNVLEVVCSDNLKVGPQSQDTGPNITINIRHFIAVKPSFSIKI